jgi:uncharacterized membrane protein YjjP (DUF1212 family)
MKNRTSDFVYPPPVSPDQDDPRVAFTLRLASALHRYGTPTHRLEEAMNQVLLRLGMVGRFFSMPTGIFAAFGTPEEHRTSLIRTEGGEVNLEKMSLLDELADRVIEGKVGTAEGTEQIETIVAAPSPYPGALTVLSFSLASATAARSFGGGWREMAAAGIIGLVIGGGGIFLLRTERTQRVFEIIAAIVASALATVAAYLLAPFSVYTTTLASLITLLPGLTLTTAMTELATGNLVSGTARLMGAFLTFLELAFGVALGGQIGRLFPSPLHAMRPARLADWTLWVSLVVAPISFTILMKARLRDIGWIVAASLVSFGGARLGTWLLGSELGAFIGAIALGLAANLFARLRARPAAILLLPGLILLVPGSIGFGSLSKFIDQDVVSGLEAAFNVALIAVALATGLLMANVILPARRSL